MKRILLALTMVGFLLPLAPNAKADAEVSLNFFYDNLSDHGSWLEVADYGYVFQPNVAVSGSDWRPYSDGYWAYTDAGWTWVSYEDFGWATYHYGRWANLDSYGWVWVPGYDWGPAWVSWRTGGDYVGWAPLPPQGGNVVYEGRAITGNVDVSFGIGPLYYNFVDIRYIGEPVLRGRLIPASRNVAIINNTVNVTNITYNNTTVINNGPNLARVNQYSTRPVQRLTLQRETSVGADFASRRGNLNRVNGSTLMVSAPAVQRSQQKFAPKQVKAKVEKPKFEKGWQGIQNRQQVEQEMKKENAQNVPPPTFQPNKGTKAEAGAAAQTGAQPNENAGAAAAQTPASVNDRAAAQAERRAQRQNRGQNAAQPGQQNATGNAEQSADQGTQQNAREQKRQQAEQRRAERAGKAEQSPDQGNQQSAREQKRQQAEQRRAEQSADQGNQQSAREQKRQQAEQRRAERAGKAEDAAAQSGQQQPEDQPNAERARHAAERKAQQDQSSQQESEKARMKTERERGNSDAQKPDDTQRPDRSQQRAERAQQQESQRGERGQRAEKAQDTPRVEQAQRPERAQQPQEAQRPDRAQRQESRRQEQASPQGQQQNPNEGRKGKKNKPTEEPSPQG